MTKSQKKLIADRVRLLISYSLEKTLTENKEKLKEQTIGYDFQLDRTYGDPEWVEKEEQKRIEKAKVTYPNVTYPNYCSAKEKAVPLSGYKNEYGLEGSDALLQGFCIYRQPYPNCKLPEKKMIQFVGTQWRVYIKEGEKPPIASILLPQNAKIEFYDSLAEVSNSFDFFLKSLKPEELKILDQKLALKLFTSIIPMGTVRNFTIGATTYNAYICYTFPPSGRIDFMGFLGYKNEKGELYESPIRPDEREPYQKIIDEWGTIVQWTAVILTALAGMICDGCTMPILMEFLLEAGIGSAVAWREWEKGNDVAGVLSFVTGFLPLFKTIPAFRGMSPKAMKELSDSFLQSGLKSDSSIDKWVEFYRGLTPDAQLALNQMLRADDIGKNTFLGLTKENLGDDIADLVFKKFDEVIQSDPTLLRKIPFKNRLWVRELGTNAAVTVAGLIIEKIYGKELNLSQGRGNLTQELIGKLDGIYDVIPERLKQEMSVNLLENLENGKNIIEDPEMKEVVSNTEQFQSKEMTNALDIYWQNAQKRIYKRNNSNYVPLNQEEVPMLQSENLTLSPQEEQEWRKRGWLSVIEGDRDIQPNDSIQLINGLPWYKPKN